MSNARMRGRRHLGRPQQRQVVIPRGEIPIVPGVIPANTEQWQKAAMDDAHDMFHKAYGSWPGRHVTIRVFDLTAGLDKADQLWPDQVPPLSTTLMAMLMEQHPNASDPHITFASLELNEPPA